jgi:hypothetical protein
VKRTTFPCFSGALCIVTVGSFEPPGLAAHAQQARPGATRSPDAVQFRGVVEKYCVGCHNAKARTGGLSLDPVVAEVV